MKQKLYALDASIIEKLNLTENDPYIKMHCSIEFQVICDLN